MPPLFPSSSRPGTTHPHDGVTTQGYPSGRRRTFGLMTLARVRGRCHTWPPQPFFFHVVGQIPVDPGSISSSFSALQLLISLARTSWAIFLAANIKDGQTASDSSSTTSIAPLQIPDILDHGSHGAGGWPRKFHAKYRRNSERFNAKETRQQATNGLELQTRAYDTFSNASL